MGVLQWVDEAKKRVENLSNEDFQRELREGRALVVDIRDVRERWREGTVPGARSAPRGMLEFWADPESPYYKQYFQPDRRTIVYCAGGMRSALAAAALKDLGFTDVAHLEGGFDGWRDWGGEVEPVAVPEEYRQPG